MSILDEIKKRFGSKQAAAKPASVSPTQQQAQELIGAAVTGKATGSAKTKASEVQRKVAEGEAATVRQQQELSGQLAADTIAQKEKSIDEQLSQGRAELAATKQAEDIQTGARLAAAGLQRDAEIEASMAQLDTNEKIKTQQITGTFNNNLERLKTERNITEDNLWADFDRSSEELEFRSDAAALEQLSFDLRMRDQEYVDTITRIGKTRGLLDDISFRDEVARLSLGEDLSAYLDELDFKKAYNASEREFAQNMASVNAAQAMQILNMAMQDAARGQIFQGAATAASSYASYRATNNSNTTAVPETTSSLPTSSTSFDNPAVDTFSANNDTAVV